MELMSIIYSSLLIFTVLFLLTITISYASYKVKSKDKNRFSYREAIPVSSGYRSTPKPASIKRSSYNSGGKAASASGARELTYSDKRIQYKPERKYKESVNHNYTRQKRHFYKSGYLKLATMQGNERIKIINTTLFD